MCGTPTHDWERVGGVTRCWPCGRLQREIEHPELFCKASTMSKKKFVWPVDRKTLEGLISEAVLRRDKSKKALDKRETETWDAVIEWLNDKL